MTQKAPGQGNFVNDLLRTEFHRSVDTFPMYSQVLTDKPHRKFMAKFIKVCSLTTLLPYVLTFLMPFVISETFIDIPACTFFYSTISIIKNLKPSIYDRSHTHPSAAHSGISVENAPRLVVYFKAWRKMYNFSGLGSGCSGR